MSRIENALEKASRLRSAKSSGDIPPKTAIINSANERLSNIEEIKIDNPYIIALTEPDSPASEEYRKLKSTILKLTKQEGKNTVMVTSTLSGEGKSITAVNLAITLSREYDHTVLLIDADLRNPSLHKYLNIMPEIGLSDCLVEGIDIGSALIKTGIGKLSFLPSGKKVDNLMELFSSQMMQDLIHDIKHRYPDRYIIIDTTPVLPFAETRLISSMADSIVFVVKEGLASLQNIAEAIDIVKDTGIMGIVYNNVTSESFNNRYHYYYYNNRDAQAQSDKGT